MKRSDISHYAVARNSTRGRDDGAGESVVRVGGRALDAARPMVIAGPCAVETREQTLRIAREVRDAGADMLRGGAWKPRTSPYSFQGLGLEGLEILAEARAETGLPVVTEVMDPRLVGSVGAVADVLQVGSRSMQNFPLLVEVGQFGKPVLLKRGFSSTVEEWLGAAEYVANQGNRNIILCERGIRTFATGDYARNTLDLAVLSAIREISWLPVIVDPSHGTGDWRLVPAASSSALAHGAHGLLIDVASAAEDRKT
ncbi:MAG: 3-deoxy-7-phosphoheptulonate synthase, partial [Planctomycetota bacterium]